MKKAYDPNSFMSNEERQFYFDWINKAVQSSLKTRNNYWKIFNSKDYSNPLYEKAEKFATDFIKRTNNTLYLRNENNDIIAIYQNDTKQTLFKYFVFEVTGYYKNVDTNEVTKDIRKAKYWKDNGYNICNIIEDEYKTANSIYSYDSNNNIVAINSVPLNIYFGFPISGFYKNLDTVAVTKDVKIAKRWHDKSYAIKSILENEYIANAGSTYSRNEDGEITHINYVPIDIYENNIEKLPVNMVPDGFKLISTFRDQSSIHSNALLDD